MENKKANQHERKVKSLIVEAISDQDNVKPSKEMIEMQLKIAKIVMSDAYRIQMKYPERSFKDIVDELAENWKNNIKNFACALVIMKK